MHTIEDLEDMVAWKIPALGRRDAETNLAILELLALDGPKTVWGTNKDLGRNRLQYPTIFRAVARLRKGRYLKRTRYVKMEKRKERTPEFGITWRGFLASMTSDKVCKNIPDALRSNPQLDLPVPREVFFDLVGSLWNREQIEEISWIIFEKVIETLPYDVETTKDKLLLGYLFPALILALPELEKYPPKKPEEVFKHPKVLEFFEKQIDHEIEKFQGTLQALQEGKQWLARMKAKEGA
jgi:hypothetical protein